ncbi:MAG: DUF2085 domain-containing protein [Candidatus Bathyarchaeota archaeon]|nr:DUF2085 domain-containing protein [Candidatus Termiticorpusculum sp.]
MTQAEQGKGRLLSFSWLPRVGPVLFVMVRGKKYGMSFFCHRLEERCIKIGNHTSFLCARCTGLVIGVLLAAAFLALNITMPLVALSVFCVPLLIDGFTQLFDLRRSNNPLRFVSGILFAVGIILFLLQG